jgi:hypothetical protein
VIRSTQTERSIIIVDMKMIPTFLIVVVVMSMKDRRSNEVLRTSILSKQELEEKGAQLLLILDFDRRHDHHHI